MRDLETPCAFVQFNLNNTASKEELTPIMITSIDKIINTFIDCLYYRHNY